MKTSCFEHGLPRSRRRPGNERVRGARLQKRKESSSGETAAAFLLAENESGAVDSQSPAGDNGGNVSAEWSGASPKVNGVEAEIKRLEYKATSGIEIIADPNAKTIILGRYDMDTKNIIEEFMQLYHYVIVRHVQQQIFIIIVNFLKIFLLLLIIRKKSMRLKSSKITNNSVKQLPN